ncbi:MAG: DUF2279 domain-containing protein [Cyclobacteriaceae bacterium]|nr:DUF2279 domain-containing protein [Cyclobacteriaceae bacterium]
MANRLLFICLLWSTALQVFPQSPDTLPAQPDKKKLKSFIIVGSTAYTATLVGLDRLWYSDGNRQSFRFFNDSREWKQMDKVGHFYSAFHLSQATSRSLQWCNVDTKKANLWGSVTGFLMLLPIEIFDGFSADYGASTSDLLANAAGAAFYFGQTALWDEVRIHPKFSFHRTEYPILRNDNTLGNNLVSELLKDYNGQTYWLSVDMDKFIKFPKWINLAVGYGADGMVYASNRQNIAGGYTAHRQFYLGIDIDLSHIKTRSKALNTALYIVNLVKLPAPALQFSAGSVSFSAFQF